MRIEISPSILFLCLVGLFIVWASSKMNLSKKWSEKIMLLSVSLLMPAFIPGHGEIIMVFPNAALFAVSSSAAWGIGSLFMAANYIIISILLYKFKQIKRMQ